MESHCLRCIVLFHIQCLSRVTLTVMFSQMPRTQRSPFPLDADVFATADIFQIDQIDY